MTISITGDGGVSKVQPAVVVGSVSQSGGVPTGAIIESGSNANGSYVKYADGTMVCTRKAVVTQTLGSTVGSNYWSGIPIPSVNMAQTFTRLDHSSMHVTCNDGGLTGTLFTGSLNGVNTPTLSAWGTTYIVEPFARPSQTYTIWYRAEGRWF